MAQNIFDATLDPNNQVVMNRYYVTYSDGKYKHRFSIYASTLDRALEIFRSDSEFSAFEVISIVKL